MNKEQRHGGRKTAAAKALRLCLVLVGLVALIGGLSACGGEDSSSGNSTTGAGTEGGASGASVATAEKELAPHLRAPQSIGLTEPLSKLPEGSTVAYLKCSIVNCQQHAESLQDAFGHLGIKLEIIDSGLSPESFSNAFAKVDQTKPDGVIYDAIPASIAQPKVEKLAGEGVPVVAIASPDLKLGKGIYNIESAVFYEEVGKMMADWSTVDGDGKANVLYLRDPTLAFGDPETAGVEAAFAANCPECQVDTLETSSAAAGKELPGEISSYLQKHPDVNHIVAQYSALLIGVPSALKVAGLDGVRMVGFAPTQINQEYLAEGEEAAEVLQSNGGLAWYAADAMARALVGDPVSAELTGNPPITQVVTSENVDWDPAKEDWPYIPGWEDQFITLWNGE